ncbi:hypothetical protein Saro_3965 (plasmid) [Novosphingobium aromaticivorans DSM 12444]|uniref:Uncharacterized protein n=2 Tax=Novosphingobium aromaticivorans TaxID=48935 RepID=A4XE46_NOVAD|nr:unknown [Novosphingobium aromaticivorans]ABP64207.1 hypothetical protein Saro_3965 [Novosphingobium aromaticivorans DSM 12444]
MPRAEAALVYGAVVGAPRSDDAAGLGGGAGEGGVRIRRVGRSGRCWKATKADGARVLLISGMN